ncbi:hypothetical protein CC79DRAFT_1335320 [Sarocladium strictum]
MGSKKITITLTQEQVIDFNTNKRKLCFATGMGDKPAYNVIAWSDTVAAKVTISWEEKYYIAATKDTFMNGVTFDITTDETDAKYQGVYTLPPTWADLKSSTDSTLGTTSFRFHNDTDQQVSAVVFKPIKGKPAPIYISQAPVLPQGDETLTPKVSVILWMEVSAETGTMISLNKGAYAEFNMDGTNEIALTWDGSKYIQA